MKQARIKLTKPVINTRFEAEAAVREICELKNAYQMALAEMNAAVTEAKKTFEDKFAPVEKRILEKSALVQDWAEANPSEFNGAKSLDMVHGLVGWRTGQPQLKTLSGWTWDRVLDVIQKLPKLASYVRTSPTINKQQLLADRDQLGAEGLRAIGVKVIQEEGFFIEPKLEQTENRITANAA